MASVRALLRAYSERETRTDRLLEMVNHALVRDLEKGSFVSLLLLRWSPQTRTLAYAGAGHEHLLVVRAKGSPVETLRSGGVVLGLSPDVKGRFEERSLDLASGDQVVMYTDGATEAAAPEGEELGLERLATIVAETRGSSPLGVVAHVIDRVQRWTGAGHPPRDDLTVVALRKT
jgi:sigma-B regulation protein RsbU (phosphoserine phosphatase)